MKKNLNNIAGLRGFSYRLFLFLFLSCLISINGQSKSNLEIFFDQIDSVGRSIHQIFLGEILSAKINFQSSHEYSVLENRLASYLIKNGIRLTYDTNSSLQISFVITNVTVKYTDSFRDGLLGNILVQRQLSMTGNFLIADKDISTDFSYNFSDTIKYEELNEIENRAYSFTQASHPSEPFFSSLIEPVIAVGAAATAVILFFTIRSK